ncbi:probable serine/threonine-protein kinase kinX isoform X1 [Trichomycterus rosablanca]|uniref:probable serine/threonine-protein kinase kinX isoform X1 n=1 Tax=Trichomycterus rosablanca TaxID=2290929 RepID=UPI002F35ECB5
MNMFSCWTLPSDEDEPHRRVNEPEKKVKKRKWWQRRQKVEMQDGEDEKGNGVKGEEMGQGVGQKVLEDQADQIPKMEKQVVLGKNKPEKKVKKRKWWQRRQKVEMQVAPRDLVEEPEQVVLKDQRKPVKKVVLVFEIEMKKLERQVDPVEKPDKVMKKVERQVAPLNLVEEPEQVTLIDQWKEQVKNRVRFIENEMKAERQVDPVEKPDQVMKKVERQVAPLNLVEEPEQVILIDQWKEQVKNRVSFIENEMKGERQVDPVEKPDQVMKKVERQMAQLNLVEEPEQVILKEQVKNRVRFIESEMKKAERQVDPVEKPDQVMKKAERQVALLNLVEEPEQVILKEQVKNRVRFIESEMKKTERQVDPVEKPDQVMKKAERQVAPLNLVEEPEQVILKEQVKNRVRFIENEMKSERQVDPVEKPDQVMKKAERQVDPVEKPDQVMKKAGRQVDPVEKPDQVMKKAERQVAPVDTVEKPKQVVKSQIDIKKPNSEEKMVLKNLERMENKRLEKQVLQMDQMTKVEVEQLQDDVLVPPIVEAQPEESGALMESACEDEGVPMPKLRRTSLRTKRPEPATRSSEVLSSAPLLC